MRRGKPTAASPGSAQGPGSGIATESADEVSKSLPALRSRSRKGLLVRGRIVTAAHKLLQTKNFQDSTTAEIAAHAGISQRTFFRYFSCKEDVVLEWTDGHFERIAQILSERPKEEPVLVSLRCALDPFCRLPPAELERVEFLQRLTAASWTLRARLLARLAEWEAGVANVLRERGVLETQSIFLANFAIGIVAVTFRDPLGARARTSADLVDAGIALLRPIEASA